MFTTFPRLGKLNCWFASVWGWLHGGFKSVIYRHLKALCVILPLTQEHLLFPLGFEGHLCVLGLKQRNLWFLIEGTWISNYLNKKKTVDVFSRGLRPTDKSLALISLEVCARRRGWPARLRAVACSKGGGLTAIGLDHVGSLDFNFLRNSRENPQKVKLGFPLNPQKVKLTFGKGSLQPRWLQEMSWLAARAFKSPARGQITRKAWSGTPARWSPFLQLFLGRVPLSSEPTEKDALFHLFFHCYWASEARL